MDHSRLCVNDRPSRFIRVSRKAALLAATVAVSTLTWAHAANLSPAQITTPSAQNFSLAGSYLSGRSALQAQDLESAARYFEQALHLDPDNYYLQDRTFVMALADGDFERAAPLIERLLENDEDHFLAHFYKSAKAIAEDDFDAAIEALNGGDINPLSRLTFAIMSAWSEAGRGAPEKGIEFLTTVEGPNWFELFTSFNAGLIMESAGNGAEALKFYEEAYGADPGALRISNAYARALAANGRQKDALEVLDAYDQLVPNHPLLVDTRKAITDGDMLEPLATTPAQGVAEALYGLGSAISRDGEELSAVYLQTSRLLNPDLDAASIALGTLFEQLGNNHRAIEYLGEVDSASPMKREAEIQIGLHYNALENLEEAREHLQALVEEDPTDLEAVTALGNVLRSHSLFEEAEVAYSAGINTLETVERQNWPLLYFRGITRERQNKWEEAEADFREVLELYPDQPMVLNYLGYSLVDRGLKLDEALEMIKTAVRLRPTDGYIVDSLGWVYYRLGRYEEAVSQLERAVSLRPQDPIINDHLGDAYWKVGRKLEARFKWNHARDLEPEPDHLSEILNKIKHGMPLEETTNIGQNANDGR
ncbi:tetratricopeptide repeat protein [Pseudovibrio exalbescens]|uniref:tetratricopeptide repeat protein n=1 Tax=Pseudovibrio exalbescens TaxID=197461 RepID=UPI0023651362|nr:tetratricopeptide repeat protein [Pseudovibrio exalbescens]MDD7910510.1 tetratricopeptide repeat protein [Pseudovibrio exalbescens]